MGRWLAPRLAGPQHWVLHDRDPDLLDRAALDLPGRAADGAPVTVETRPGDIADLTRGRPRRRRPRDRVGVARSADPRRGRADRRGLCRGRVPGPAHPLRHRTGAPRSGRSARCPVRQRVQRSPAPYGRRRAPCSVRTPSTRPSMPSPPTASPPGSGRARGGSGPMTARWWPSGSPDGWTRRSNRSRTWPRWPRPTHERRREEIALGRLRVVVEHADLFWPLPRRIMSARRRRIAWAWAPGAGRTGHSRRPGGAGRVRAVPRRRARGRRPRARGGPRPRRPDHGGHAPGAGG